jgi:hypothetical protein
MCLSCCHPNDPKVEMEQAMTWMVRHSSHVVLPPHLYILLCQYWVLLEKIYTIRAKRRKAIVHLISLSTLASSTWRWTMHGGLLTVDIRTRISFTKHLWIHKQQLLIIFSCSTLYDQDIVTLLKIKLCSVPTDPQLWCNVIWSTFTTLLWNFGMMHPVDLVLG